MAAPITPGGSRFSAEDLALEEVLEGARRRIIARLLDGAHAELAPPDLANLLLAVRGVAAGEDPAPGEARLSAEAALTLRSVWRLLGAEAPPARDDLVRSVREARLRAWLEAQLDEVAARPRGGARRHAAQPA